MVSNLYIDKNLKHLKGFKGTFSCDNIPFWGSNDRKMFIVNLSQENEKGSHFVFIEIEKDKALYLDPLGKNLSNSFIKKSLVINGCKKLHTNQNLYKVCFQQAVVFSAFFSL